MNAIQLHVSALLMVCACLLPKEQHAQCVYRLIDTFDDETPINAESLVLTGCNQLMPEMVNPNWHNVFGDDDADWLPKQGGTPTSSTGPFATSYVLPGSDLAVGELSPSYLGSLPFGSMPPPLFVPTPSIMAPIVIPDAVVDALSPYTSVWPGPGGVLGSTYLYVEATGCCNGTAILESESLSLEEYDDIQLAFRYHMLGINQGELTVQTSVDDGENWVDRWTAIGNQGQFWKQASVDLTTVIGGVEGALIRIVATVGGGELSDIAIDDITILGSPPPLVVFEDSTLTYAQTMESCWIQVEFDKPSDSGLPCHPEPMLDLAELRLNLSLGDDYKYGGTDFGEDGIELRFALNAINASGQVMGACSAADSITLQLADDRHPEQLYVHDFSSCYNNIDHFELQIGVYDTAGVEYPAMVDDLEFHITVDIEERFHAHGNSVELIPPVLPATGVLAPVQFSWESDCDYPAYRFQLLRLHPVGEVSFPDTVMAYASLEDWIASALTLEVNEPFLELTMMEGSGVYAWRVMPIGNEHPGGEANDMNFGDYSSIDPLFPSISIPQTLEESDISGNAAFFSWNDPNDDVANRSFSRSFSANKTEQGQSILVEEKITYQTEDGFESQLQRHSDSEELVLIKQALRDFSGRGRLSILPVPIVDEDKDGLNFEENLLLTLAGQPYGAEDFDGDDTFMEPAAMTGKVADYYSDAPTAEPGVPNAGGYPFTAMTYTRDATNRPVAIGAEGPVKRLRDDGQERTTRILYSAVGTKELTRIFGHEAPSTGAVDKVITIDPENVTRVAYVDEQGRTIATCLSQNSSMDSDKIVSLAPAEGFSNAEPLESNQVTPYRWEVFHEMSFSEQTNLVLDYALEKRTFSALCDDFCAQCDYEVITRLVKTSDRELEVIFSEEHTVEGSVLTSCGGALETLTFSLDSSLSKGTYVLTQSVTMHNMNGDESYLQSHISAVREEVTDRLDAVTVGLEELLDAVVSGDEEWLYDFYDYCEANSSSSYEDDEGITWYTFDVGEDCDAIEIPVAECPYDCDPDTRDFEAFFNSTLEAEFLAYIDTATSTVIPARDNLNYIVTGRSLVDGSIAISGNYPLFPTTPAVEGGIRNVAAESYGVADGQFNQLIENLIADGDAYPEYYPGYDCYNIHYKLEAIAENHIYYLYDTVVVDKLMDELGYHFKGTRNYLTYPGQDAFGNLVDSSVSEGEQGCKSHPHKFVKVGGPGTTHCTDEESVFAMASIEAGLEDLDYTIEEEREEIESIYMLLHNCLHGESEGDVQEELTESDDETATEWGADGITAENLQDAWEEDCEEAVSKKQLVYSNLAREVIGVGPFFPQSQWTPAQRTMHDCVVAQLKEHALSVCQIQSTRVEDVGLTPLSSPLDVGAYYKVKDDGSGEFVRYGRAEYGPHGARDVFYVGQRNYDTYGNAVDYVKSGSSQAEYFDYDFEDVPHWVEKDIQNIAGIMYGSVDVCTSGCDSSYTELPLDVKFPMQGDTLFCETFDSLCTVDFGTLPVPLGGPCSHLGYTHQGGGSPQLVLGEGGADLEGLVASYPDTTTSMAVLGNGVRAEAILDFIPGETYEVSLDLAFENGVKLDHFFAVISPFEQWGPQCISPPFETFYPPGNTAVIANWDNLLNSPSGSTMRLTQEFVWQEIQNPWDVLQAPNQSFSTPATGQGTGPTFSNRGFLHLYPKQYLLSDTAEVRIDNICIVHKTDTACPPLWVKYSVLEPVPDTTEIETCEQQIALQQLDRIASQREGILRTRMDEVEENYFASCVPEDVFTIDHPLNYYQYTLFYYDAAGRLVRTVPPKGVDADDNHTRQSIPDHTHVTEYAYNGLGNLVRKETPDGGVVNTWYDRLERVRFTQTAQDAEDGVYRYVCYDIQSRPIRSGVKALGSDVLDDHVDDVDWPVDDPSDPSDCADCYERIVSVYGDPVGSQFEQTHLIDRLSFMANDMGDTIAYSYNATGQIEKLYQYVDGLGASLCEYEFDASSGLIQEIVLNRGRADEFHMRHLYDEDQRVTETFSSRDGRVWSRDGAVEYYGHGLLKRQELGHYGVQGQDFVYNIHQKLIGINAPSLEGEDDPGADGESGTHAWVSPDVFGLHLAHYRGEFGRDGSPFNASNASHDEAQDLFHDHIASTSFQQRRDFEDGLAQVGHSLQYDEEGRVRGSTLRTFSSTWANDAGGRYSASFDYDPNSNLLSLTRAGSADAGTIDDVEYAYVEGKNWLDHIMDSEGNVTGSDLASQSEGNFQYDSDGRLLSDAAEGLGLIEWRADGKVKRVEKSHSDTVLTFRYNPLGHRVAKITESAASGTQDTTWYVPGREGNVMAVYRTHGVGPPALEFNRTEVGIATFDPSGSAPLFGAVAASSDFYTRHVGGDRIEIKDHLGNVRAVVSDLELAIDDDGDGALDGLRAEILKATDYHAYGSLMDGRSYDSIPYRFGFHGKETDAELKGEGNSYDFHARFYDPRLARWLSTDPMEHEFASFSPYEAFHGNPISNTDPEGEAIETPWDAANVGMGVVSLGVNVATGNVGGVLVDGIGLTIDLVALFIPGVPGGAGAAINAFRAGKLAKKGVDAVRTMKKAEGASDAIADARKVWEIGVEIGETGAATLKPVAKKAVGAIEELASAMDEVVVSASKPKSVQKLIRGANNKIGKFGEELAGEAIVAAYKAKGIEVELLTQVYVKGKGVRSFSDIAVVKKGTKEIISMFEVKTGKAVLSRGQKAVYEAKDKTFELAGRFKKQGYRFANEVRGGIVRISREDVEKAARAIADTP